MAEVTVAMPLALTPEMIRAVRDHETTKTEDRDESHRRLGWLLCAYDVIIHERLKEPGNNMAQVPYEALDWLLGDLGAFEPSDAHLPVPEGYKRPQFWWREEFRKRAGLPRSE